MCISHFIELYKHLCKPTHCAVLLLFWTISNFCTLFSQILFIFLICYSCFGIIMYWASYKSLHVVVVFNPFNFLYHCAKGMRLNQSQIPCLRGQNVIVLGAKV